MKTLLLVAAAIAVLSTTSYSQFVSNYTHQTDTLTATTSWTTINYGKTYLKRIEVVLDSCAADQLLWLVEGTDTTMANRMRIPRKSNDGLATFVSYQFETTEDTIRVRASYGRVKIFINKRPYFQIR